MSIEQEEAREAALDHVAKYARDYRLTFGPPWGRAVLTDLATFCRAAEPCVAVPSRQAPIDVNRTLILLGRNEVWHRIQRNLNLQPEDLFKVLAGSWEPEKAND